MYPCRKILPGMYRVTRADNGCYGNITKHERSGWHADIRNGNGELIRLAGIWPTKQDAVSEVQFILSRML